MDDDDDRDDTLTATLVAVGMTALGAGVARSLVDEDDKLIATIAGGAAGFVARRPVQRLAERRARKLLRGGE